MSQVQQTEKFEEFPPSFTEMKKYLSDEQRDLLTVLLTTDNNTANTSDLREWAGIATGSMRHFTSQLERWELIEEIDRVYAGRGSRAILWQLTERGEEFCVDEDGLEPLPSGLVRPADFDELREEVVQLRREKEAMKEAMVQIAVKAGGVREEKAREWLEP